MKSTGIGPKCWGPDAHAVGFRVAGHLSCSLCTSSGIVQEWLSDSSRNLFYLVFPDDLSTPTTGVFCGSKHYDLNPLTLIPKHYDLNP